MGKQQRTQAALLRSAEAAGYATASDEMETIAPLRLTLRVRLRAALARWKARGR
ncbi:MAG: hypothetical protein KGL46_03675 [Hyphomicrobiales bacterium]|nr:hypothetical protein [Hyphomicrobiales bacterium]